MPAASKLMTEVQDSQDLIVIKKLLAENKIPPEHAVEFCCVPAKLEILKEKIRKKANGNCFFFTKEENKKIHLIAFLNLEIAKSPDGLTAMETIINTIKEKSFSQGSFNPKGVVFGSKSKKTKK